MVGHSGAGVQLELCDEASGVGWTVGEQTTQGSALRADSPSGTGDAARQELIIRLSRDHPSYELLLRARQNILALAAEPYRA